MMACSIRSTRTKVTPAWRARALATVLLPVAGRPPTTMRTGADVAGSRRPGPADGPASSAATRSRLDAGSPRAGRGYRRSRRPLGSTINTRTDPVIVPNIASGGAHAMKPRIQCVLAQWIPGFMASGRRLRGHTAAGARPTGRGSRGRLRTDRSSSGRGAGPGRPRRCRG